MVQAVASGGFVFFGLILLGVFVGMLVGVLPGLTFVIGVLLILPFTYAMEASQALVLMIAVYVAGTYGGVLTSILLNIPGEPNDVPLTKDGYTMSRQGRAAEALGWAALAALVGGIVGWIALVFVSQPFAALALQFGSAEYFAIILLGLTGVLALSESSTAKSFISLFAGMLVATVGIDDIYGAVRYDFGTDLLRDGINYLAILVGVYALTESLTRFGERFGGKVAQQPGEVRTTLPGLSAIRSRAGSFVRGTSTGALISAGPGVGSTVGAFVAYGVEKQFGRHKLELGTGSPSGIIAPQAASTANVSGDPGQRRLGGPARCLPAQQHQPRAADLRAAARADLGDLRRAPSQRPGDVRDGNLGGQAADPDARAARGLHHGLRRAVRLHGRIRAAPVDLRRLDHDGLRAAGGLHGQGRLSARAARVGRDPRAARRAILQHDDDSDGRRLDGLLHAAAERGPAGDHGGHLRPARLSDRQGESQGPRPARAAHRGGIGKFGINGE
jgi:TctA family transporter